MKLRHKISLLAGAVLLLVLLTCAGVLLLYARKTILALAEDQARDKQSALSASFSSMVRYYAVPEDSDAARESLIRYCFTRFADQEGVLMRGGETLCSSVAVDPSLYALPDREDSRTAVYRGSVDGRQLLIVASLEWVQTDTLYVGLVRDITEVYDAMARLTRLFLGVCAAGVALGMGLLFLAVKKSTAPLSRLTAATGEIAAGAYDKRVTISGRDEVGDLGQSFNRMAEAVENKIADLTEQNERQRLFIGGVSHEFKTPLAAVGLHGDLLENAKMSEAEREDSLQHIRRAGAYMTSMTQSLMELLLLDKAIETEERQYQAMKDRIKFMYEQGDSFYLEIMFNAKSFGDFITKAGYIDKLEAYVRQKLDEYTAARQWTELCKQALEAEKAYLDQCKLNEEAERQAQQELLQEKR